MKHKHHIIPKHVGGTDDPSNIVELTIKEHAEAHKLLFEKYGRWQDYIAWLGLEATIPKEKIMTEMWKHYRGKNHPNFGKKRSEEVRNKIRQTQIKLGNKPPSGKGIPLSKEHKEKISLMLKGKKLTQEHREKLSKAKIGTKQSKVSIEKRAAKLKGRKITWDLKATTPEANLKRKLALTGRPKPVIMCPYCGKSGGASQMKQWHFDKCKEKK